MTSTQHCDLRELTPAELDAVNGGVVPVIAAAVGVAAFTLMVAYWF